MDQITFNIRISNQDFLRYYQGSASWVNVTAEDGRRLKLPAKHLRQHLTHNGIEGRFCLTFDDNNKMISLQRLR